MKETDGFLTTPPGSATKFAVPSGSLAAKLQRPGSIDAEVRASGHTMPVPVVEGVRADAVLAQAAVSVGKVSAEGENTPVTQYLPSRGLRVGQCVRWRNEIVTITAASVQGCRVVTKDGRAYQVYTKDLLAE